MEIAMKGQQNFGPARATSHCDLNASLNLQLKYLKISTMKVVVGEPTQPKTQFKKPHVSAFK